MAGDAPRDGDGDSPLLARVVVLAGPSGCGKTVLARRTGLPIVALDDFYRDGDEPGMPRLAGGMVDWEDPRSWDRDTAVEALATLCRTGEVEVPTYSFAEDRRTGTHVITLGHASTVIAEGIFAAEVVAPCRERGLLADALVLRVSPLLTFWRRLARDHREARKPPLVLARQSVRKLVDERRVVARQHRLGCRPVRKADALGALSARAGRAPDPAPARAPALRTRLSPTP